MLVPLAIQSEVSLHFLCCYAMGTLWLENLYTGKPAKSCTTESRTHFSTLT